MRCKEAKILISNYLANEVTTEEKRQLEDHLKSCEDCQKFLSKTKRLLDALKEDTISLPSDMGGLPERLAYRLLKEEARPKWSFSSFVSGLTLATAICILIFFSFKPFKSTKPTIESIPQVLYLEEGYPEFGTEDLEAALVQGLEEYLEIYEGGWGYEEI